MSNYNKPKPETDAWALHQLEKMKPEILKLFLDAPEFGITSLAVHYVDGVVKRVVFNYEESVRLPEECPRRPILPSGAK